MSKNKLAIVKPTPEQLREENRARFIGENCAEWQKEGSVYRQLREAYGLTLRQMSGLTGYSHSKLVGFELGRPVGTRKALCCAYALVSKAMKLEEFKKFVSGWGA